MGGQPEFGGMEPQHMPPQPQYQQQTGMYPPPAPQQQYTGQQLFDPSMYGQPAYGMGQMQQMPQAVSNVLQGCHVGVSKLTFCQMYQQPQPPQQHPQMPQQYRPQDQQGGVDDQDADGEQDYGGTA